LNLVLGSFNISFSILKYENFIKKILIIYLWILFLPLSLTLKLILFILKIIKRLFFFSREKANNF
jgi:hypothetical protein